MCGDIKRRMYRSHFKYTAVPLSNLLYNWIQRYDIKFITELDIMIRDSEIVMLTNTTIVIRKSRHSLPTTSTAILL